MDMTLKELLIQDWQDWEIQEKMFLVSSLFIENLINDVSGKFSFLKDQSRDHQEEYTQMFKDFIGKILNLLPVYLPYSDKLVEVLDFVEFKDPFHIFKQKIKIFC